jgi:hypothetical protein
MIILIQQVDYARYAIELKGNLLIFVNPEVLSGLGEDTFWTWIIRETGAEVGVPKQIASEDIILHYSTMGKPAHPSQTIALLWELYPEMSLRLGTNFKKRQRLIDASLISRWVTVPTHYSRAFYARDAKVLPIAIDSELFTPAIDKFEVRKNLGLVPEGKYVFWGGGSHAMKGRDLRDNWLINNPEYSLLFADKDNPLPQDQVAKLMQAADGILNTSRLVPLFMIDWEALACGLPIIDGGGIARELPLKYSPREFVRESGWFRVDAVHQWLEYIEYCKWELRK